MVLQALTHLGDGQRGGVGGKDGLILAQSVQTTQQLLLHGHVLSHALDDQIGVSGGLELLHQHTAHQIVSGLLRHLALGHTLIQRSSQLILVALRTGRAGSIQQDGVALAGKHLSDTATHSTCTKNSDLHNDSS